MNSEQLSNDNTPSVSAAKPKKSGSGLAIFTFLLVLVFASALVAAGWLAWPYYQQFNQDLAGLKNQQASLQAQLKQQLDSAQAKQAKAQQEFEQGLNQQLATLNNKVQQLSNVDNQDWLLAEALYLMRLANQRLQYEHDWNSALSMLQAADNVLVEARNPSLGAIRAALADEMLALRAMPQQDTQGIVLRIQSLQKSIPQLPWIPNQLPVSESAAVAAAPSEHQPWYVKAWDNLVGALTDLVRIRVNDQAMPAALTPDQHYYLQQNLYLMLEQAQAAVVREDNALYQLSLTRVNDWVSTYLRVENSQTKATQAALKELLSWQAAPARPDISASLLLLQKYIEQQRRSSVPAAPAQENAA